MSTAPESERPGRWALRRAVPAEFGVSIVLTIVVVAFSTAQPNFRSAANVELLMKQASQLAIVSVGMTLVIATGGIDISVGSVLGLCSMMLGWLAIRAHWSVWAACIGAVAAGGLCGLLNGLLIAKAKLQPIIVTLATFAAARAATTLFNAGGSLPGPEDSGLPFTRLNHLLDGLNIVGLPTPFWLALVTLVTGGLILRTTTFGRQLLAIGGNRSTSRLSGVPVARIETLVYVASGALAGLAAVISTGLAASAAPDAGLFLELISITAVVLGGTLITGGKATMLGTALGVATIGVLISGVRLCGQEDQVAWFLVGLALLMAVEVQKRLGLKRSEQ